MSEMKSNAFDLHQHTIAILAVGGWRLGISYLRLPTVTGEPRQSLASQRLIAKSQLHAAAAALAREAMPIGLEGVVASS